MISIDTDGMTAEVKALIRSYEKLPTHIARRHLKASMGRALKDAVPVLRRFTPPVGVKRGRRKKGERRSTGKLRRMVTTRGKFSKDYSALYGVVGYRYVGQDRKPIWVDEGTSQGAKPRRMILVFSQFYSGPTAARLKEELRTGLERGARDLCPPPDFYRRGGRTK